MSSAEPNAPAVVAPAAPWSPARLGVLWLAGTNLRLTLLATAPVLPFIRQDLGLDETAIGALSTLPVLVLGLGAIPGALLIARLGPRRALIAGLLLIGITSALRGVGSSATMLFGMTFLMGIGIAVLQPTFPSLVAEWFPTRIGLATAIYSNGLLSGEMLAASLTLPLVLPLAGGSWQGTFALWSLPVFATALVVAVSSPHTRGEAARPRRNWWPDWRDVTIWRLGLMQVGVSATYFGSNSFIPDYLHALDQPELIVPSLAALNTAQIPATLVALLAAGRLVGQRLPLILSAGGSLLGLVGLVVLRDLGMVASAALVGFAAGVVFVLILALPPLYARHGEVHRVSAAMFTIGYTSAFVLSVTGGALWDATHQPAAAFIPAVLGCLAMGLGAITLPRRRAGDGTAAA